MTNPRQNRLHADFENILNLVSRAPTISIITMEGKPPEKHLLEIQCKSIDSVDNKGNPHYRYSHQQSITIPEEYPHIKPDFNILTPIFHPNVHTNASVSFGDFFIAGMRIADLIIQTIHILRFENVNTDSPYNIAAAQWFFNNPAHIHFPLETTQILTDEFNINIM